MADRERVVELIRVIAADPSLRERLTKASEAERGSIIADAGSPDVTPTDVARHAAQFVSGHVEEIDESDLEAVAGGNALGAGVVPAAVASSASAAAVA